MPVNLNPTTDNTTALSSNGTTPSANQPNGTPDQTAAAQFASLFADPTQSGTSPAATSPGPSAFTSPFSRPFSSAPTGSFGGTTTAAPSTSASPSSLTSSGSSGATVGANGSTLAMPAGSSFASTTTANPSTLGGAPSPMTGPFVQTSPGGGSGSTTNPTGLSSGTSLQSPGLQDPAAPQIPGTTAQNSAGVETSPGGASGSTTNPTGLSSDTSLQSPGLQDPAAPLSPGTTAQNSTGATTGAPTLSDGTTTSTSSTASAPAPASSLTSPTVPVNTPMSTTIPPTTAQNVPQGESQAVGGTATSQDSSLSDAQLAAAASLQAAIGLNPASTGVGVSSAEDVTSEPTIDGDKIQAMMDSVTKELGMRDLSQLQLGGEMTLKLDQGALPETEIKVRFEGNDMVISVDSQSAAVNSFCTDNLALLQQSVSSGMKEEMQVRVEIRNPPDQPNQQRQGGGSGGNSSGGGDSSQDSRQQAQNTEGDSLAS